MRHHWLSTGILGTTVLLSACSVQDSATARRAASSLIGLSQMDLETCLGVPNRRDRLDQTSIFSYDGDATNSGGLNLSMPIYGGVSVAGGGNCHLVARLDNGRVTAIHYTGDTDAPLAPEAYCAPLVKSCLEPPPTAPSTPPDRAEPASAIGPTKPDLRPKDAT
jgi:hypothetical protein